MKTVLKIFIGLFLFSSCGGGKDSPSPPKEETKELGAFNLVFPDNNLVCTEGNAIGTDEVSIEFQWSKSDNAVTYNLQITNQATGGVINTSSTTLEKAVTLSKNTQFSWTVTAILGDKTKASAPWNFYSEGIALENYAPFPADISITDNENGTVQIDWPSTDLDDDIESYDVYLGTDSEPELILDDVTYTSLAAQPIEYNTVYYLKVVTADSNDNTSTSEMAFKFDI